RDAVDLSSAIPAARRHPGRAPVVLHSLPVRVSPAHRDLPSFPTRRSSDLSSADVRDDRDRLRLRAGRDCYHVRLHDYPRAHLHRSEEHTSELQSPCNLVCRLLLEKKNFITLKGEMLKPARTFTLDTPTGLS